MKLKNKGFTLIELMIVVVILGVLMSTVLPKLTGAQARARDTGRIADLGNISAALTTYYDDNGQFIGTTETSECIASGDAGSGDAIKIYLEGAKVPTDPQVNANTYLCDGNVKGRYWYAPLTKDGIANNAYILCADMETYQKANTDVGAGQAGDIASGNTNTNSAMALQTTTGAAYAILAAKVGTFDNSDEATQAGRSQYCMLRP